MYIGPERHRPAHKTGGFSEAESFPKVRTGGVYDSTGETLITWEFLQNIHRLRQGMGFGRKREGSQRLRVFQKA